MIFVVTSLDSRTSTISKQNILLKLDKIKQNWTTAEDFDACFCVSFDHYC